MAASPSQHSEDDIYWGDSSFTMLEDEFAMQFNSVEELSRDLEVVLSTAVQSVITLDSVGLCATWRFLGGALLPRKRHIGVSSIDVRGNPNMHEACLKPLRGAAMGAAHDVLVWLISAVCTNCTI